MNYKIIGNDIYNIIPANNAGKFRFKKRNTRLEFGETFSTREGIFDKNTYLEWQIGYDVPIKEAIDDKATKLNKITFVGSNKKIKYPYELSELFYESIKLNHISIKEVKDLLSEIMKYKSFIDEKEISVEHHSKLNINGLNFEETSIKLPTFFMLDTADGSQIEISIQKQQYATGIQPMVYFCIPMNSFINSSEFLGKSSTPGSNLTYVIGKNNSNILSTLMRVFGMASERHNYDIIQIIKILIQLIG